MTLPWAGSLIVTDPEVVLCTCHQTQSSGCGPRELFRAAVGKQSLFSGRYRANARPICRRLFSQAVALAAMWARDKDASNMAANTEMIVIVTSSSIKVKAGRQLLRAMATLKALVCMSLRLLFEQSRFEASDGQIANSNRQS